MKQLFTLLFCLVLGIQFGFGQCELSVTAFVLDPSPGGLADACWDDEFGYGLIVEASGSSGTDWNYTINGGELQPGGSFDDDFFSGILPVFGENGFLNEHHIQIFSASEPDCSTSTVVYAPLPDDCDCRPTMDYSLGTDIDDNGTPDVCWDDFFLLSFSNVTANNLETYELLLNNYPVYTGEIGDAGGTIMIPANDPNQRLTLRGDNFGIYCVNVYDLAPSGNPDCSESGAVHLSIGSLEACAGETICLPLRAQEFDNILGFQFSISYDATNLTYSGAQNYIPLLPGFSAGVIGNPTPGNIVFASWNDPNGVGVSLAEEAVLVELCFTTADNFETFTTLDFSDTPVPIEVVDSNEEAVIPQLSGANVTCNCPLSAEVVSCICDDNGTAGELLDDVFYCWVDIVGATGSWTTDNPGFPGGEAEDGLYEFGPYSIIDGANELIITDNGSVDCSIAVSLEPPVCDPPLCEINIEVLDISCDDNGTPGDITDNFYTTTIIITGGNSAGWIGVGEMAGMSGLYDEPITLGPLSLTSDFTIIEVVDQNDFECIATLTISTPDCGPICNLEASQIGISETIDNGTPDQCSDDTYLLTVLVEGLGVVSAGGWRVVLNNGSFVGPFPYDDEVMLDFLPIYNNCGNINTSFQIIDSENISCLTTVDITEPGIIDDCDCEAFLCYTEVGLNDNGTPFDCSDDFMELAVTTDFIGTTSGEYELLLDGEVVLVSEMGETMNTIEVPADLTAYTLSLRENTNPSCIVSELLPLYDACEDVGFFSLSLGEAEACNNEQVCIPLIAETFSNILGFQFSVNYDHYALMFTEVQNINNFLPGFSIGNPSPGNLTFTWNNPEIGGISLLGGTILTELCFESSTGQEAALFFSGSPTPIEVVDGNEMEVIPTFENGQIICECFANEECNLLQGQVFSSNDCVSGEIPLSNWLIEFSNENYLEYRQSDADGNYSIYLPEGEFNIKLIPPVEVWESCQPEGYTVAFSTSGETQTLNLLAQATEECALLEVEMSMGIMRRCFEDQVITINYENVGTVPLDDGFIGLLLPEELTYSASSSALIGTSGDTLIFAPNLPLPLGNQGQFQVYVGVSCEAELNSALCAKAFSLPYQICPSPDDNWLGGSLLVTGECTGEEVVFNLRNVGNNPLSLGNSYIIIQDGVMLFEVPETIPPLLPGGSAQVSLTADGSTYRLEATQEPFHPGFSHPTAVVEGCGTNTEGETSTGFVNQFSNDDENIFIDEDCQVVTGSYDPNDKQAEPRGYGDEHYILPEQSLEYTIRFQNTGNDTAFTVVVQDTLSQWLDMQTFRPGVSSHPYELSLDTAHAISFVFNDILLPDSTTNFTASQGFVTYQVRPKSAAPLETRIENTAAIYFDFNEAIITNTTYHQLGNNFVEIINATSQMGEQDDWIVFPNPTPDKITLKNSKNQAAIVRIFDALGQERITAIVNDKFHTIDLHSLPAGWYSLQVISDKGHLWASIKLIRI